MKDAVRLLELLQAFPIQAFEVRSANCWLVIEARNQEWPRSKRSFSMSPFSDSKRCDRIYPATYPITRFKHNDIFMPFV